MKKQLNAHLIPSKEEKKRVLRWLKRALRVYRISRYSAMLQSLMRTDSGFCHYFARSYLKAKTIFFLHQCYKEKHGYYAENDYWYEKGDCEPRIELLKLAIKKLEDQLK